MQKLFLFSLFLLCAHMCFAQTAFQTPLGKWKTIDDQTGRAKSIIEITQDAKGHLQAKVVKIFPLPSENPNPLCEKCTDYRKNQPVLGMTIMNDLQWSEKDGVWQDGSILDPENGELYDCYISRESADKLKVRGFIRVAWLGRTQYWERVE